jgi:hypothetical protein
MMGMAASKSVQRAERFCLQSSPPTKICLARLMRVLNVVFGELPSLPKQGNSPNTIFDI